MRDRERSFHVCTSTSTGTGTVVHLFFTSSLPGTITTKPKYHTFFPRAPFKMQARLIIPSFANISRRVSTGRIRGFATLAQGTHPDVSSSTEEKDRLSSIRLYRILQRTCRSFPVAKLEDPILIQPVLKANDWGRHVIFKPPSPTVIQELFRLFYVMNDEASDLSMGEPSSIDDWYYEVVGKTDETELPPMTTMTCWTSIPQLQEAIRTAFRVSYNKDVTSPANLRAWAIRAVQLLQEQQLMWSNSSCSTTEGVRVTATSRCIGSTSPTVVSSLPPAEMAAILEKKFRFAYRIRVENVSDQAVQLLGRYWCIEELTEDGKEDDSKEKVKVDSPATGAVGHLPVLRPGQVFEYMSGTDLVSTKGRMMGHFYMAKVPSNTNSARAGDHVKALNDGDRFEVEVAPFALEATNNRD